MRFEENEDQSAFLSVLDQMTTSGEAAWSPAENWERYEWSSALDRVLDENGFYDCAAEPTLGTVAAAEMVYRLAGLPVTVECAASALLRPFCAADLPRPLAVIDGDIDAAIRYLPVARSVLHISDAGVRAAVLDADAVDPVQSQFAYPMGRLKAQKLDWTDLDADPQAMRERWRVAVAAELAGSLKGGLDSVLLHVRDREQFGRPLGSFQTIQHRLAGAAVKIDATRLLCLRAAQSGDPADAATALAYVQDASTRIVYDLHQFMGAMGLTLEHPLHRWTYRARLLRSALGGAHTNLRRIAERRWGKA